MNAEQPMNTTNASFWRVARWSAGAALLLIPLIAMQFSEGVKWGPGDFIFGAVLIFGSLGAWELISRRSSGISYRIGLAVSIGTAFLLLWVNAAVGITDGDADALFPVVVAVAAIGALVARFRPLGMARAMAAAAIAMALAGVGALLFDLVPAFNSTFEVLGITTFFVVLFSGSAVLFREAARELRSAE